MAKAAKQPVRSKPATKPKSNKAKPTNSRPAKAAVRSKPATAPKSNKPKPAGRPTGSKTQNVVADASKSRCPKCDSTDRTPYAHTKSIASAGRSPDGSLHTHVVFRHTKCVSCGQSRVDRSLENRTAGEPAA